tara:strand:+ start:413 stop:2203 length:1791 start_codon:yes stop_codon:yes gene_type:complete
MVLDALYEEAKTDSLSEQIAFCRKIDSFVEGREDIDILKKKIAFVSTSTMNGIKESLKAQSAKHNLLLDVYLSEYNQFAQEIINKKSNLYSFNPEVVFLHLDLRTLSGENFFNPNEPSFELNTWKFDTLNLFKDLIDRLIQDDKKVVVSLLEVPDINPLGVIEASRKGLSRAVAEINLQLMSLSDEIENLFLFDYDNFLGKFGKKNTFDSKLYYLADIKLKPNYLSAFARELSIYLKALFITPKKCLVLDLDNTLWGGVIGEAGLEGIDLGPEPAGRPFMEFQQYILSLHNRGIILAINSKNNLEDALNVINNHPHMILKEENFAAMEVNWNDKVRNLKSLASQINIGLDSMVFVDDDNYNREMVREFLPEVAVVNLPKEFSEYVSTMNDLDYFSTLKITDEDINKGKMYAQEKQRKNLQEKSTDLTEYLEALRMECVIKIDDKENIQRIAQMTQKTNQFNMTTKRYVEKDITNFIDDENTFVLTLSLSDKYGEYGTTGLAIVKNDSKWFIDTFLLSCRILGRSAEEALMSEVISLAKFKGASEIFGSFIRTQKNVVAEDAFESLGFKKNDDETFNWKFSLKKELPFPKSIKRIDS